jgi:hypothetical protein
LQAGVAARVLDTQPERAGEAMQAVEEAGRQTLTGLSRMLGALRGTEPGPDASETPLYPAPGLADVDHPATATTAAGVDHPDAEGTRERLKPPYARATRQTDRAMRALRIAAISQ